MKNIFTYLGTIFEALWIRRFNFSSQPRFINFLLTYNCNARCKMCNIWSTYNQNPQKSEEELTLDEIEQFLEINKGFLSRLIHVGFTGGEPLLMRDDFVDVVRIFRKHLPGVQLGVQTNGLDPDLAKSRLEKIVSFYPDFSLAVSLDGIKDTHSRMRGIDSAFDKAIKTINYAKGLGIQRITCGMTLTPYNFEEITQVKALAEKFGCEFSCFLAEQAEYFNNHNHLNSYSLSEEQKREIAKQLMNIARDHYFMDNLRLLLEGKRKPRVLCFSGFTSLVVDAYGNVKPCILKVKGIDDDIFGNIKEKNLASMLRSQKVKRIRQKIKQCNCWCQCEVSSSVVVCPLDVLWWFAFYCRSKKLFLKEISNKLRKFNVVKV